MTHQHHKINTFPKGLKNSFKGRVVPIIASFFICGAVMAADEKSPEANMQALQKIMKEQVGLMKPELQQKVKKLSPKTQKSLMKILAQHSRYSNEATLRQVMNEVLSDYHSMVTGLMTDNAEQAADSARRLANHRIPVGGLLPYMGLENINDERLAILEGFNDSVEGSAKKLAAAADAGDLTKAASYLNQISGGCVACHAIFRGRPGKSGLLR